MKRNFSILFSCFLGSALISTAAFPQKSGSAEKLIIASDLRSHVEFLASPFLKGRMDGEPGLDIAARYLASQAQLIGLKPANSGSYFQPYTIIRKSLDANSSYVRVVTSNDSTQISDPPYNLVPMGPADISLEGEVVFAGYGIKSDKYKYNDLEGIDVSGKILLVMQRAPMSEDGKRPLFSEPEWMSEMSLQLKLGNLFSAKPKAVLFVPDPKSGSGSLAESSPGFAGYLTSKNTLKGSKEIENPFMAMLPKVLFVSRSLADALLSGTGTSLEELQKKIDSNLKPSSFLIPGKILKIREKALTEEKTLNNVAGYIEGSDPVLKNELVIFSAHYDHIGAAGDKVNAGADDDASGCAALLSTAEAFQGLKKKPLRSILFLWVSGEEIGLFGSESYVKSPLFPLEKTVADLNMDMIGRVKSEADSTKETPMTGEKSIFVITDSQSRDLRSIADETDGKSTLDFDYSLSGRDHPLQLFARSDHFNFVKKDIPVLFFTSGLHTDYHTPGDIPSKLNYDKMELVTRTMYRIGLTIANRKTRITVDNPYSSWAKSK
jgi:hypothetical protein